VKCFFLIFLKWVKNSSFRWKRPISKDKPIPFKTSKHDEMQICNSHSFNSNQRWTLATFTRIIFTKEMQVGWLDVTKFVPKIKVFIFEIWARFYQHFTRSFYARRSQKCKKYSQVVSIFLRFWDLLCTNYWWNWHLI